MLTLQTGAGALLLGVASALAWQRGRQQLAVGLLMGAALLLRLLMAGLDPFLHDWDERYHAVVARNLLLDPFKPMLRAEPLLPYDYRTWCCNHVWLHKQPLFLWQMALSMKVFGVSELALRLPSALLGSLVLWPVYRLGCLVFRDQLTGYLGAGLVALAYYQLELVSGALGMDHNDVAFLAYVTGSIWAYYEYRASARPGGWLLLTGALAGAAVLCKWLPGLLVYAAWGLDLLQLSRPGRPRFWSRLWPELGRLLASLAVAAAVALPWQFYSAWRFPRESAYERAYNTRHFTEALEGHAHAWYYHFGMLPVHYGLILGLIGLGVVLSLRRPYRAGAWPLLLLIALIYLFFTLAATKMYSYTYVVSPLLLLLGALPLATAGRALRAWPALAGWRGALAVAVVGLAVALADLRPWGIYAYHFQEQSSDALPPGLGRATRVANAALYRELPRLVPPGGVVVNVRYGDELAAMFYCGCPVYAGIPSEAEVRVLRAGGRPLSTYPASMGQAQLPAYLLAPGIEQLWGSPR